MSIAMNKDLKEKIDTIITTYQSITQTVCFYYDIKENIESSFDCDTHCSFCKLIGHSDSGGFQCKSQRKIAVQSAIMNYDPHIMVCHAGLLEWIVPVFHNGTAIGVFISGFVSNSKQENQEFLSQEASYLKRYTLKKEDFRDAITQLKNIEKSKIKPYAQLLFALTRLYIPSEKSIEKEVKVPDVSDIFFFNDSEESTEESTLPTEPLTHYVLDTDLDSNSLNVFWKGIEKQANNIFINVMAGRVVEARKAYEDVMTLAFMESTITNAKISAETLFHIIFLKYYKKTLYDVRFYRLAFKTIEHLYLAESIGEIQCEMLQSFDSLYSLFNTTDESIYKSSVTKTIMRYLENNYQKNVLVEDIAKLVYLSPAYVSRLFKAETTFTIKWCLNNIRMFHAQQLLLNTNMPIKDISQAVGYSDIRGFYKMFSKHFGITCSEMRKKYSNMV